MINYCESRIYKDMMRVINAIEAQVEAKDPPCKRPQIDLDDFDDEESIFDYNQDEFTKWNRLLSVPPKK